MKRLLFSQPRTFVLMFAALLPLVAGCDLLSSEGDARIQVQLTDAPSDYVESAEVWISRVYLPGAGINPSEAQGNPGLDLFNDPENPFNVDLLLLQDGLVATLTEPVSVEGGTYNNLRIIVDSAFVTLTDGVTFQDGTSTQVLFVPSGSQTGINVQLTESITAEAGVTTVVLVDFDVNQNFVLQGNPDLPDGVQGMLFTPTLKELRRAEEGS